MESSIGHEKNNKTTEKGEALSLSENNENKQEELVNQIVNDGDNDPLDNFGVAEEGESFKDFLKTDFGKKIVKQFDEFRNTSKGGGPGRERLRNRVTSTLLRSQNLDPKDPFLDFYWLLEKALWRQQYEDSHMQNYQEECEGNTDDYDILFSLFFRKKYTNIDKSEKLVKLLLQYEEDTLSNIYIDNYTQLTQSIIFEINARIKNKNAPIRGGRGELILPTNSNLNSFIQFPKNRVRILTLTLGYLSEGEEEFNFLADNIVYLINKDGSKFYKKFKKFIFEEGLNPARCHERALVNEKAECSKKIKLSDDTKLARNFPSIQLAYKKNNIQEILAAKHVRPHPIDIKPKLTDKPKTIDRSYYKTVLSSIVTSFILLSFFEAVSHSSSIPLIILTVFLGVLSVVGVFDEIKEDCDLINGTNSSDTKPMQSSNMINNSNLNADLNLDNCVVSESLPCLLPLLLKK